MKRPFVRQHGILVDSYQDISGRRHQYMVAASMLDEVLCEDERTQLVSELGSGIRTEGAAIYALSKEQSADVLEGLLQSLQQNNIAAPMALKRFADDPRVPAALIDAVRRVPGDILANFAQVVGLVGGEGAEEALHHRLEELLLKEQTFADDVFFNAYAGSLSSVAEAILKLNPENEAAVQALVRLLVHPCAFNRRSVAMHISELLQKSGVTKATQPLWEAIERLQQEDEPLVFLAAAPALALLHSDVVIARCEALLDDLSKDVGEMALHTIVKLSISSPVKAEEILLRRIAKETSIHRLIEMSGFLIGRLPEEQGRAILRQALQDESPSLRLHGINLLSRLHMVQAARLAQEALADEPDPVLQKKLNAYITRVDLS